MHLLKQIWLLKLQICNYFWNDYKNMLKYFILHDTSYNQKHVFVSDNGESLSKYL